MSKREQPPKQQGELIYTGWKKIDTIPGDKVSFFSGDCTTVAHIKIESGNWVLYLEECETKIRTISYNWFPEAIDAIIPLHFEQKYIPYIDKRKQLGSNDK